MKLGGLFLLAIAAHELVIAPCAAAPTQKYYRSIDEEAVPVWDEFVPVNDKTNYEDSYDVGKSSPGEWNWWNTNEYHNMDGLNMDKFWDPTVDYKAFEFYTERENLDGKNMILTDKRSCPFADSVECKKWLGTPHIVEILPSSVGFIPIERKKTDAEIEVEKLLKSKSARKEMREKWYPAKQHNNMWVSDPDFQGCPFETEAECMIWKSKPTIPETLSNQKPMISPAYIDDIIAVARAGKQITADMKNARPLVDRYRSLLAAARACCTSGLIYNLRAAGASKGLVYKFMVDDANFYQFGERCLMITDDELDNSFANTETAEVVADIRNTCLCQKKEYFESLLAPFVQVAEASPEFAENGMNWQYVDGLKRKISVSINRDVNIVLRQLDNCPD